MLQTKNINSPILRLIFGQSDIILAVGIIFIIVMMIIPIPTLLVDLLLATVIALALVILLTAIYNMEPLEFSVFPGMLLVMTLFRLALNVTTTRLILSEGYAGHIIDAFGGFVIGGNYVVGLVIFLILTVVNFIVITKGSGRIAEVAARFTLDAMPGKQMSIDADLNNGIIDEDEARTRRDKIAQEADFYGAMDGASKFVRGDAVAGILITFINILGGFAIGIAQMGMSWKQALNTFTILTVGDGLVSQIPALMISTSAGIIVSRAAARSNLGEDLTAQLFAHHRALYIISAVLMFFAIIPGLPFVPFTALSIIAFVMARIVGQVQKQKESADKVEEKEDKPKDKVEDILYLDPLEIQIGYGLIPLVDPEQGGDLLERVTRLRKQFAGELGIIVPPIRVRDNVQLSPDKYEIKIRGNTVTDGQLMVGYYMALNPGDAKGEIVGINTEEPAYGLPAKWITSGQKDEAELMNWVVIEPSAVLTAHLMETLRLNAHRLLSRESVHALLDNLKREHRTLVEEIIPGQLSVGQVQKVLQILLSEGIPVRDLMTILETLSEYSGLTKDPELLTEAVRSALGDTIAARYQDKEGIVNAVTLDPNLEQLINEGITKSSQQGVQYVLPPDIFKNLHEAINKLAEEIKNRGLDVIFVTVPSVRRFLRKFIEPFLPQGTVLSYSELPPKVQINSLSTLSLIDEN